MVRFFLHLGKITLILELWKFGRRPYRSPYADRIGYGTGARPWPRDGSWGRGAREISEREWERIMKNEWERLKEQGPR